MQLTATLNDPTKSGDVILYYAMPDSDFTNQLSGVMMDGVFTETVKPWIPASGNGGDWRFKVYWEGDSQYSSIFSNTITVTVGVK